jgi:hypothetical protein
MNSSKREVNIKKYLKKHYIPFVVFFVFVLILNLRVVIHEFDDEVFRDAFRNYGGVRGWLKAYTELWSGRIVPHFILIVLLNKNLIFWRVANSLMFTLLTVGIFNITINKEKEYTSDKKTIIATIICGIIFFIPIPAMASGAIWITGSVTYLWPLAFSIVVLIPFKRLITGEKTSRATFICSVLSSIYASYVEQSAAIMLAFSGIILVYCIFTKVKVKIKNYLLFAFICINSFIGLTVPGNKVRQTAETLRFYSDFDMISFTNKIFLGVNVTFTHLFKNSTLLMIILSILVLILVAKKVDDKSTQIIATIPSVVMMLKLLSIEDLFNFTGVNNLFVGGIKQYIPIVMGIVVSLIIIYMFFVIFDCYKTSIIVSLFFSAALCSGVILGISPTIYASGSRIFFMTDILLVMCVVFLVNEFIRKYEVKTNTFRMGYIGFVLISLVLLVYYTIKIAPNMIF